MTAAAAAGRARAIFDGRFDDLRSCRDRTELERRTRRVRRAEFRDRRWWCAREEVRDTNSDDDLISFRKELNLKNKCRFTNNPPYAGDAIAIPFARKRFSDLFSVENKRESKFRAERVSPIKTRSIRPRI